MQTLTWHIDVGEPVGVEDADGKSMAPVPMRSPSMRKAIMTTMDTSTAHLAFIPEAAVIEKGEEWGI